MPCSGSRVRHVLRASSAPAASAPSSLDHRPSSAASRSASRRVAATIGRRLDASRTIRSLPSRSPSAAPDLAADEQPRQVVPAVERARARPPGRRPARPRPRRSTRARPRRGPGTAPSPGAGPGKPEIPTMAAAEVLAPGGRDGPPVLLGPAAAHGGVALPGGLVGRPRRPAGLRRRARRCSWSRRARPGARWWSRRSGRSRPAARTAPSPVMPDSSESTARPAPCSTGRAAAVGGQVEPVLPRLAAARAPVLEHVERAAHGARPPRRALPGAERRPRVTNPIGRRRQPDAAWAARPSTAIRLPRLWLPSTSPGTSPT